jgi:hypothetical protein
MDSLDKQPKGQNMDMTFGTRNVRNLYWVGSLITILMELSKPNLHLVRVQVRWEDSGPELA